MAENIVNNATEVLSFRLGAEEYAISILKVQEIRGYDAVTRIANAPEYLKGVVNLRGSIVPIVDMKISVLGSCARSWSTASRPSSNCSRAMQKMCGWCLSASANPAAAVWAWPATS